MSGPPAELCTRVYVALDPLALSEALAALRQGLVVAFPTDTVYGVGCDLWNREAIARLYWAKARPKKLAIPVLVSAPTHVHGVAQDLPSHFWTLSERFWPGGLTLVVPRQPQVPQELGEGGPTVAVRMPDHPVALQLIEQWGGALAVTSANLSGRASPRSAAEVLADLGGRVAVLIDGGECPVGVASSVVDLTRDPPLLLRQGGLDLATLREVVPSLELGT